MENLDCIQAVKDAVTGAKEDQLIIIKFGATWCGPCKQMDPELETYVASDEKPGNAHIFSCVVDTIEDEKDEDAQSEWEVENLPCLIFFSKGAEVYRFPGTKMETLKNKINEFAAKCQ